MSLWDFRTSALWEPAEPTADYVAVTPSGNISATDLQSALEELDTEKLAIADIDDVPVNGVINAPISSNWAYDHAAATQAHGISSFGSTLVDDSDASTARSTLGLGNAAVANVSSTPTSGATTTPISSDAAFALLMKLNLLLGGI